MKVLVDTSIWSLLLRRTARDLNEHEIRCIEALKELIGDALVAIIGPIRQELLSGVSKTREFTRLRSALRPFKDVTLTSEDYEVAAQFANRCRAAGIASTTIDMQICAVASKHDLAIFTTDTDFLRYSSELKLQLFKTP